MFFFPLEQKGHSHSKFSICSGGDEREAFIRHHGRTRLVSPVVGSSSFLTYVKSEIGNYESRAITKVKMEEEDQIVGE